MKTPASLAVALLLLACSVEPVGPTGSMPVPREIVDLGALVTERTPAEFWGSDLLQAMGFEETNTFDVHTRNYGPLTVSNSYYTLFNHGGPHVDAPGHVGLGGGLDSYPVESFAGPLKVFDFSGLPNGRSIARDMLVDLPIDPGDVVLLYTGFTLADTENGWPAAVALDYEAAAYLADLPVRAIGTDAINIESMTDTSPVPSDDEIAQVIPGHHAFLSRGIPVFEQLVNVDKLLGRDSMFFVGAPLNIRGGDGMMVRPLVLVY